jgi:hypothetical protein
MDITLQPLIKVDKEIDDPNFAPLGGRQKILQKIARR